MLFIYGGQLPHTLPTRDKKSADAKLGLLPCICALLRESSGDRCSTTWLKLPSLGAVTKFHQSACERLVQFL